MVSGVQRAWKFLKGTNAYLVVLLAIFLVSVSETVVDLPKVVSGLPFAVDYALGMFPPEWSILPELWLPLLETVQMAVSGITLATMVALPLSFLAAKETTVSPPCYYTVRLVADILRSVPVLVWALLFVCATGLGPLAGVLAMSLHCSGALTKHFSETIETMSTHAKEILEAMRVDGANEVQVLFYGMLPLVLPLFISRILYYLESNIRDAAIMGMVGAGGLGLKLIETTRLFRKQETLTIIIVILVVVVAVDLGSRYVRKGLAQG